MDRPAWDPAGEVPPPGGAGTRPDGPMTLADLDPRVRGRVLQHATDALAGLPATEVPARLRPFLRFAARRRATLAGPAVQAVLDGDPLFRQRVAERLTGGPGGDGGPGGNGREDGPVGAAALAWLSRPPGWADIALAVPAPIGPPSDRGADERLAEAVRSARADARRERAAARADGDRLRVELSAARAAVQRADRHATREQVRADALAAERDGVVAAAGVERAAAAAAQRRLRARIDELQDALARGRRDDRQARAVADTRLRLLIDTVLGAAHGLARELALPASTAASPAETVDARPPGDPGADATPRWDDPDALTELLALPGAHLIVDGYNVTKAAVPQLTLAEQRAQLLRVLAALAVQTGAEVTAVFDGADVTVVPAAAARGVRVRFSPPGVTADAVIRAMARAEPTGRPVLVVSSDREVAVGVERAGAWSAPSSVLTGRLLAGRAA